MSLNSFIEEHAILSLDELSKYENQYIWLMITNKTGKDDYYASKIRWLNNGIYDHNNQKYITNSYDPELIYFCQNQSNLNEYFSVYDFMPSLNDNTSFNSIYTNEEDVDTILTTFTITRSSSNELTQKILDQILESRGFTISFENGDIDNHVNQLCPEVLNLLKRIA